MSYILDALRKSEKRRSRAEDEQKPLHTARIIPRTGRDGRHSTGALILTGCILIAVCILTAGWWWSSVDTRSGEPGDKPVPQASTPAASPLPATMSRKSGDAASADFNSEQTGQISSIEAAADRSTTEDSVDPVEQAADIDLSANLQARIDKMTFNGHVYSPTPSLRMIMIDEVVVREGAAVSSDLILAEITEHGLIIQSGSLQVTVDLF